MTGTRAADLGPNGDRVTGRAARLPHHCGNGVGPNLQFGISPEPSPDSMARPRVGSDILPKLSIRLNVHRLWFFSTCPISTMRR